MFRIKQGKVFKDIDHEIETLLKYASRGRRIT